MIFMPKVVEIFPGVFRVGNMLATKNLVPGKKVYGERLVKADGIEYRQWDLYRSKLAGAIAKGLNELPIKPGSLVLYLGAASGTTVSHVSDIVGEDGGVFAIEFAQRPMRDLLALCEARKNVLPIFADARKPQDYAEHLGGEKADALYQDVAQPDQAEIFVANAKAYLKKEGQGMLCIKSQSIDVTQSPEKSYGQVIAKLEAEGLEIEEAFALDPYDKDHMFIRARMKSESPKSAPR